MKMEKSVALERKRFGRIATSSSVLSQTALSLASRRGQRALRAAGGHKRGRIDARGSKSKSYNIGSGGVRVANSDFRVFGYCMIAAPAGACNREQRICRMTREYVRNWVVSDGLGLTQSSLRSSRIVSDHLRSSRIGFDRLRLSWILSDHLDDHLRSSRVVYIVVTSDYSSRQKQAKRKAKPALYF
ncbi:hypothetical protein H6P81_012212 [Aristolochia fimbriata]|uniref:Uncharacterized protein n=1 Tax=Aristolochia fimbriata TaxID=158543 RepID=A0AAV7EBQ4_ARIFI|nr:hypothetical protein H6P81_012212 [Aristolochia fimbriata]